MINGSVMTLYNKKMYQITDICFDKKISDTFESSKDGSSQTYLDYYQKKWNLEIKDKN